MEKTKSFLKRNIIPLFMILVAICLFIYNRIEYPKRLEAFHQKTLSGEITYLHSSSGGTQISLNDSEERHVIHTKFNESLDRFFYRFAAVGDSVYKAPNDKYIHVFKDGKAYLFETTQE